MQLPTLEETKMKESEKAAVAMCRLPGSDEPRMLAYTIPEQPFFVIDEGRVVIKLNNDVVIGLTVPFLAQLAAAAADQMEEEFFQTAPGDPSKLH